MTGDIVMGYWNIRGLAAPLRMMCEYAGVPYTDNQYDAVENPEGGYDFSQWLNEKKELKKRCALINLPYVECDGVLVSQSTACMALLGKHLGLWGEGAKGDAETYMHVAEVFDLRNAAIKAFYCDKSEYAALRDALFDASAPSTYTKYEAHFNQTGHKFVVGDKITAPDFHLWEVMDQVERFAKAEGRSSPLAGYSKLQEYYARVKALPQLAVYFSGPKFRLPVNNKMANFIGKA